MSISLNPEVFIAGGLLDDADVEVLAADFCMYDYGGNIDEDVPALHLEIKDDDGETHDQYYGCGSANDWAPSDDGSTLVAVGSKTALNSGCNTAFFMVALVNAGFPAKSLDDGDVSALVGVKGHMQRLPTGQKDDEGKDRTTLVFSEIHEMPGKDKGKKAGKKAAGKKTATKKTTAKKAAPADDDLAADTTAVVMEILAEADGPMAKKDLGVAIFKLKDAFDGDPKRKAAAAKLAVTEDFLADDAAPWTYEDGELTL